VAKQHYFSNFEKCLIFSAIDSSAPNLNPVDYKIYGLFFEIS